MTTTIDPRRLAEAVEFAAEKHQGQVRKGNDAPYVCHLLNVAGLTIEHGGDTDQAIAALLHDALEDCADVTRELLTERFGERVARMVAGCTDTLPGDTPEEKSPWRERKGRYLDHLREAENDTLLVAACDKRHNLSALVGDLKAQGLKFLSRFKGNPHQQVWYYEEILRVVVGRVPLRLQLELEGLIHQLRSLIQAGDTQPYDRSQVTGD